MSYFAKHKTLIETAVKAIHQREFYTAYPEHHKAYDEASATKGEQNFQNMLNGQFVGLSDEPTGWVGEEVSPYTGKPLEISYPAANSEQIVKAAERVKSIWGNISADERAGLLAEALDRLQQHYFELAHATQHTTGQAFNMAFQASGPHSNDRALEAIILAWHEIKRFPEAVRWEKPMGKTSIKTG